MSARTSLYRNSRATSPHSTLAAAALIVMTLVAAGGIAYAVLANQPPEVDAAGCLVGTAEPHSLAAIIDLTDPIPRIERGAVQTELDRRAAALGVGAHFSIIGLAPSDDDKVTQALFDRCKPKAGFQVSKLIADKDMQAQTYASEFAQPLQDAIGHLDGQPSKASPIIEGLAL